MKRLIMILFALALCVGLALAEENAEAQVRCESADGIYTIRVALRSPDEVWTADEMAQDDSVVRLIGAGTEDGVFTARYEAVGDGEVSVYVRRFIGIACAECHGFDLLVSGGVIKSTGGSYTASPAVWEQDDYLYGEWLEKDTQFTALDIRTNLMGDGWDVVVTSPMTHGAYRFTCTMRYDCELDAFVYADGTRFDMNAAGEFVVPPAAENLCGQFTFGGTEDALTLLWRDGDTFDAPVTEFERMPGLPAYAYTGDDPVEAALADYAVREWSGDYLAHAGDTAIPVVLVLKTEAADETHLKAWANVWAYRYAKQEDTLLSISGGEYPCAALLEKDGEGWKVVSLETAEDGDGFGESIREMAEGDADLAEAYFSTMTVDAEASKAARIRFIRGYAEANGLPVTAIKDYGWDPIPLFE